MIHIPSQEGSNIAALIILSERRTSLALSSPLDYYCDSSDWFTLFSKLTSLDSKPSQLLLSLNLCCWRLQRAPLPKAACGAVPICPKLHNVHYRHSHLRLPRRPTGNNQQAVAVLLVLLWQTLYKQRRLPARLSISSFRSPRCASICHGVGLSVVLLWLSTFTT